MSEQEALYDLSLGVSGYTDVFVPVCCDDVLLVVGEEEGGEGGGVAEDELPVRVQRRVRVQVHLALGVGHISGGCIRVERVAGVRWDI